MSLVKYGVIGVCVGAICVTILMIGVRAYIYYRQPYVEIKKNVFYVEVARTPEEQRIGLMFRKRLAKNRGMLFVFNKPAIQTFWMKNTYVPLDIIFIGADFRIINIVTMPAETLQTCSSVRPALYVLEISAGLCNKFGIKRGDTVIFHRIN